MKSKKIRAMIVIFVAVLLMGTANYTKVFLGKDDTTKDLQYISVELVGGAMLASCTGQELPQYGLMETNCYNGSRLKVLTNDDFTSGYHNSKNCIAVDDNEFTRAHYIEGNILKFYSGNSAIITDSTGDGDWLYVSYEFAENVSGTEKNGPQGSLNYLLVIDGKTGEVLPPGSVFPYYSQLGLQGKLFSLFPKTMSLKTAITMFQLLLAFSLALAVVLICVGLYHKYDVDFAVVFYLVTLLSPWVIGFSTNLYWMEVTWFLPLLVGIYCSIHIESQKARVASYILAFTTIAFKSACGYEYITVVMLGTIVFLLADLTMALIRKQKDKVKLIFRTTFFVGLFALLGFVMVILLHGQLRGDGDILAGLQIIYREDVLRRTLGGDASMFQDVYTESLEASILYVLARYFWFKTPLLLGISGKVFIILVVLSFTMVLYKMTKKQENGEILAVYIWFGIMCTSWFILGKAHSYVHTFLNFVLWYMGYVQIIFYVPIHEIATKIRQWRSKKE